MTFIFSIMEDVPARAKDMAQSTNKEPVLSRAGRLALNGRPSHVKGRAIQNIVYTKN